MRWRPLIWLLAGLLLLSLWWWSAAHLKTRGSIVIAKIGQTLPGTVQKANQLAHPERMARRSRASLRRTNSSESPGEMVRNPRAILLENALLDTTKGVSLDIPAQFQLRGEPGSYLIQARGSFDQQFRRRLSSAGADIISYIPNNSFLVRASAAVAHALSTQADVAAVLPYQPYFKVKTSLLDSYLASVDGGGNRGAQMPSSENVGFNLLVFGDARGTTLSALSQIPHLEFLSEQASPFGPVVQVRAPLSAVPQLAGLSGVQEVEFARKRVSANDLSRAALGIAVNSLTVSNYLGLTGTNIVVCVNDTGIDANQPDLQGRVLLNTPASGTDTNGHGTHVAGIIAASGLKSLTVTNSPGSSLPPVAFQFRGKAPGATLLSVQTASGDDAYLQETASHGNALISNNSWHYANDNEYDLAAVSYDAAVRDALPGTPGAQPMLFVFAAGNSGAGSDGGAGGQADSIQSPGTAKNVITVGAVEDYRSISNQTWTCTSDTCQTNVPWLGMTDSSNQVAGFSSRGNVGLGVEGQFGRFKPDVVAPGTFLVSTRSGQWDQQSYYSSATNALTPSPDTNYFQVLSNLNQGLGPFYRFESGSSLAAAGVSGTLALMEEFYQQRLAWTNSPALMKALLINGAQSLGGTYDLNVSSSTNYQGWGLAHLPSSAPNGAQSGGMWLFEQSPTNALATGQSHTRFLQVSTSALSQPLRVTLAWTDPPGNPVAGPKLVNDLDLVVTNLDTGQVYLGNDIAAGQVFNQPWDPNTAPNRDFINNVENVYLAPALGANYSVTVLGAHVNANAVNESPTNVLQDYALVICSGDGQSSSALLLTNGYLNAQAFPPVTVLSNNFIGSSNDWGSVLLEQTVGANAAAPDTGAVSLPSEPNGLLTIGNTNQWRFYVVSNANQFSNAVFLTFDSRLLSSSSGLGTSGAPREADIDLYVSQDPALLTLAPAVLAAADTSLSRGGTEMILYSNASPGPYYVGVKSESQGAAAFGLVVDFSDQPYAQDDGFGNQVLRGFPTPAPIPAAAPFNPGIADLFCVEATPLLVQRAIVSNVLTAPAMADLAGTLTHNGGSAVLNNYSNTGAASQQLFIYDDSQQQDIPGAQPSDGPGTLQGFAGGNGNGVWWLRFSSTNQAAECDSFTTVLQPQAPLTAAVSATLLPGACREDNVYVPPQATNLTISVNLASGDGPLTIQVLPAGSSLTNAFLYTVQGAGTNLSIVVDTTSQPPINGGLYALWVCNQGTNSADVNSSAVITLNPGPLAVTEFSSSAPTALPDDALTNSTILVTSNELVSDVAVGVRIDHPRISDLVLRLISPKGTPVLLAENRGGVSIAGMGGTAMVTNVTPVSYSGGPEAVTNTIDTGQSSGTVMINFDFYSLPDDMRVYYEGTLLYDSGLVSSTGSTMVAYGPGNSTGLTVVMNEGGNTNDQTAWFYKVTSVRAAPVYFTFTENTNLATLPVKFAPTPFTNYNYSSSADGTNGIFYLPEESLTGLVGEPAMGVWKLEILDDRAGATDPSPALVAWQLGLRFQKRIPDPQLATPGASSTNILAAGQMQWYAVDVPEWASFASNSVISASSPVRLWFNQVAPPTGTNVGDVLLQGNLVAGTQILTTNGAPPLNPSNRYFLGIENTNADPVSVALEVAFNVATVAVLQSGVPYPNSNPGAANAADYYLYVASSNAMRVQFEIDGPTTNMTLVARKGLPLPTAASYDYASSNPGTNDDLIVIYDFSKPVPLSAGKWYLAALDVTGAPVNYTILATEYSAYGTNITIAPPVTQGDSFCLTWSSLPGVHYYVQGITNVTDTNWVTVSDTLTAFDVGTSFCVPLASGLHYFRVCEGIVVSPSPLVVSNFKIGANGVKLDWTADANAQFNVLWRGRLNEPNWQAFSNVVTSTTGLYSFLDDGSQTGGLGPTRFYRLFRLP